MTAILETRDGERVFTPLAVEAVKRACYTAFSRRPWIKDQRDYEQLGWLIALENRAKLEAIKTPEQTSAYLYRACYNRFLTALGWNRRRQNGGRGGEKTGLDDKFAFLEQEEQTPEARAKTFEERIARVRELYDAGRKRSEKVWRVVELTLQNLEPCEIARLTGQSRNTVNSALDRFKRLARTRAVARGWTR